MSVVNKGSIIIECGLIRWIIHDTDDRIMVQHADTQTHIRTHIKVSQCNLPFNANLSELYGLILKG